jgi:adenylate kinase family enzyme
MPDTTRRIVFKGTSGAGKTVLAAEVARRLGLTYIELDALHHGPNWAEPTAEEFRARVQAALDAAPCGWVVDGSYDSKLGETVLGPADTIVWLDLPLRVKLPRVWDRTISRIRTNAELWNGNKESWRGAFVGRESLFVWMLRAHVRHRREWPEFIGDDPRCVRLRSVADVDRWLDEQTDGR